MNTSYVDLPELRHRLHVFSSRAQAGERLVEMLQAYRDTDALVAAIPAGGVPVAAPMAQRLGLDLDVAVVSKVTLPWNSEVGYGAVAFDGTVLLNDALVERLRLSPQEVQHGVEQTREKVERRVSRLRSGLAAQPLQQRQVIVVDDGLASGFTMRVAIQALRNVGATRVVVAVPTAHARAAEALAAEADLLVCANIRAGFSFAVADAYAHWYDVDDDEMEGLLLTSARGS
jgi:predicted phosphoribosyltransferase